MKRYRELFYSDIDLQDEPEVNDYVFTIDPVDHLGPANAEQRAERKERRRTERRASLRRVLITIGIDAVFGLGLIVGAVIGSLNPDLVTGVLR